MRKVILTIAALGITFAGFAQEKYVTSANMALAKNPPDYAEAKENIDKASANPETSVKPKTLFVKAEVYFGLQQTDKSRTATYYQDATAALLKLVEVKPDYETEGVNMMLVAAAAMYYNQGIIAYSNKDDANRFTTSAALLANVIKIRELDGGKRFTQVGSNPRIDTVMARTRMYLAFCSYYNGKYAEAIPMLIAAKDNPITKLTYVYEDLIDAYDKQKSMDLELATILEARAAFPSDQGLRNDELNYYIVTGKQDELVKKLEVEAAKDPKNGELQFSMAIVYSNLANPKSGDKPANRAELMSKAEAAFQNAINISPDNGEYNYNLSGFYNNQAKDINDQMNALGSSAAETKKYDALKPQRDALFNKALPYAEKAYDLLDPKSGSFKGGEKNAYFGTLQVLITIYSIQSKMDKVGPLRAKLNAIK